MMKNIFLLIAVSFLFPMVTFSEEPLRGRCWVLERQVEQYQDVVAMARKRKDRLWEENIQRQIDFLNRERFHRCGANVSKSEKAQKEFKEFLTNAAALAKRAYNLGLL